MTEREIPAATAGDLALDLYEEWWAIPLHKTTTRGLIRLAAHYKREAERLEARIEQADTKLDQLDIHWLSSRGGYFFTGDEIRSRIESINTKEAP